MAIGSIKSFSDDVQIELLKVLLNMACTTWWSMNEVIILRILNICQEAYCTSNAAVKIAAQATASQTLWAFCDHLQKEEKVLKVIYCSHPLCYTLWLLLTVKLIFEWCFSVLFLFCMI